MKLRWKIAIGVMVLGIGFAVFVSLIDVAGKRAVAEVRQTLQREGFKTDLSEFDFTTSPELRQREHVLTNADFGWSKWGSDAPRRSRLGQEAPRLMQNISDDAALVVWQRERLPDQEGRDLWPQYRDMFAEDRRTLDAAVATALSGPLRFELDASHGMAMLLRHLAPLKTLAQTLGQRALVDLHDGDSPAAWTNLLAATRLVTAWEVEPVDISHLVRFAGTANAFHLTWQMLQTNVWSAAQLRRLQGEWEAVDFFRGLPETVAFKRASGVAACELQRREPVFGGMKFKELVRYPRSAWSEVRAYWGGRDYRWRGVFEDEKALYHYFRDREVELRNAVQATNWSVMRNFPGVTNIVPFQSTNQSRVVLMLNLRQVSLGMQQQGASFLGRAAEAEMRRRLIITALALERFHRQRRAYPAALAELMPEFVKQLPVDFGDGQPLRYRRTDDGHFVLYSVGLNGVDDTGRMPRLTREMIAVPGEATIPARVQATSDLVWPRPATAAEADGFYQQQILEQKNQEEDREEAAAEWWWEQTVSRQARAEKLLASTGSRQTANPVVNGKALNEWLQNKTATGTNQLSMAELLTLKQITAGGEPETVTFEIPIAYDGLTNLGSLLLYIDPVGAGNEEQGEAGCVAAWLDCRRATNGNCLLVWDTIYETPGRHALQLGVELEEDPGKMIAGPLSPFVSSNVCQFSVESAVFNPEIGATLRARLPEANASYSVDINSPEGNRLHTITGTTTNGVIKIFWNLRDDRGVRMTNESFGTIFHVTLTDSGRMQTMRGP